MEKAISGWMASASPAKVMLLPLLPQREKTEVVNFIYQSTCAEKSHILPGGGARAKTAQDE